MTERAELINDIEKLKAERNRLLRQVEEAEQWEGTAWDSFNALADHLQATEKKQAIAQNYWEASRKDIELQFEFVASQIARVKKVLDKKRYELLEGEIDELTKEIEELADVLGLEIEELPKHLPFYTLPAEEIVD
ncbi:hypothetical protein VYI41_10660 [Streptococcus anginosus]|jgi:predicted  nucleic acid-binding Zn-ribbon protein|nr:MULTISPECIES: hypothetical protein [Bacillota]KAA9267796.1 hypothetical protein F6I20_11215 [Streptococcus anginosus]MDU3887627.1 hypothetical protein [Veillonella sp.]MED5795512.1 hypothetical protein [Streptococcus anginosus]MED5797475.1 hypothetical protein [Streptococcus anginosus]MED5923024.1 hypothetical protein [Streptococcus anginosus]